ncbi:unknown protein [Microcystis aeruginosa NIES-843]|uniref:Uncharacterized protein n=1 Tax=Microcystis aeruginosa (strain NIES-843 / IAM M-2473) TaxID=449447 RepID=B0JR65_MICAN|nr:unknown protein [Microcystis aeruginosa NIES-843]
MSVVYYGSPLEDSPGSRSLNNASNPHWLYIPLHYSKRELSRSGSLKPLIYLDFLSIPRHGETQKEISERLTAI